MDRERAELHLRLLAEAELRRAGPALRDTAAQSPDIARVARVTQALTPFHVLEAGVAEQILDDFWLALSTRRTGPRRLIRAQPLRHRAGPVPVAGSAGPRATLGRVVPLGQLIQVRGEDLSGEVYLLSYAQVASGPQLSLLARTGVRAWPRVPPLERFTAIDDRGTSYRMQVRDLGGEADGWTLMMEPDPAYDPRWLDLTTAPGEPAVRIDLVHSAQRSAAVTVSPAALSPGEHLLHAVAARLLAAGPGPRTAVADGLGDVIAALHAADVLPPFSPVPGQLAALCGNLNLSGHGITAPPAPDLPAPWLDVLAHQGGKIEAALACAAAAVTFPELDGIGLAILGLHTCEGRTVLHAHGSGPMCQMTSQPEEVYFWPTLWIRDSAGRWHATHTVGRSGIGGDTALRLEVVPPLSVATAWIEVLVAGQSAQARATLRLCWELSVSPGPVNGGSGARVPGLAAGGKCATVSPPPRPSLTSRRRRAW